MASEKDILRRALGRMGRVPPELLGWSRQRVRENLKTDLRPTPLPPPDATPADLTVLRRPFYITGVMGAVCLFAVGGAVVRWKMETRPSSVAPKSASTQTAEPKAPVPSSPSAIEPEPPVTSAMTKRDETQSSGAATQPQAATGPTAVEAPRPRLQFTLLPPGEGKVILDRACGTCHRAASVGAYHYTTRAQYAEVVSRMIAMGAEVSEQEAPVLIDYLFENLGARPTPELDSAGRAILERACTGCHSLNGIENYSYDSEEPYKELVETMVSYGAILSEAEKTTLIRYLFTTYRKL